MGAEQVAMTHPQVGKYRVCTQMGFCPVFILPTWTREPAAFLPLLEENQGMSQGQTELRGLLTFLLKQWRWRRVSKSVRCLSAAM